MAKNISSTKKTKINKEKNIDIEKEEILKNISNELTNKVKDKITKDVIDDVKEDITILVKNEVKDDLKKDIEKEIKNENKRLIRKKRGKIFRRDIIIIVLLALIVGLLYYMYKQGNFSIIINNSDNKEITNSVEQNTNNNEDYSYLLETVRVNLPLDNLNAFYLYTGIYDEASINASIKLTIAYANINKEEFSEEEMKKAYKEVFGTDKNYQATAFNYECKQFKYDSKNAKYILANDTCVNGSNKELEEKIIKITKEEDLIYIETVMGVYDRTNNSLYDYQNIYNPVATNLVNNFNLEDYKDYLSLYKYTFKYSDGKYHFQQIVKLS